MHEKVSAAGFSVSEDVAACDVVIVNTCSFIQAATEESIEAILDIAELDAVREGKTKLIVAGCMPARYGTELEEELGEVCAFVPCDKEGDIVEIIGKALGIEASQGIQGVQGAQGVLDKAAEKRARPDKPWAYVKLSEGCDRFCSYCTIPLIRGRYHSFPFEVIANEVARVVEHGAKEVVFIAQDSGRWGSDLPDKQSLATLLEAFARRYCDIWFRVMYVQPEGVTKELLDVMAAHDNICSYLDIPLQHVDADLLQAMNRTGSYREFRDLLALIRLRIPDITVRTTLIAGFPNESEEAHQALCDFVEEAAFDYVGVFPYSREDNTKAASLPNQLDEDTKLARAQKIRDIADAVSVARVAQRIGKTYAVLVCGHEEDGQLYGRAQCQAPDVDGVVYLERGEVGEVLCVTINDTLLYEMEGA
ncbi:MAG: 30S ribosomal protein S12 methylthiotransferase RimO [Eggerthellaceae bacterium]|nr:30S ribosomal protein S12 methylthiotransferase RimO [Eggerthellaceae bacterium]